MNQGKTLKFLSIFNRNFLNNNQKEKFSKKFSRMENHYFVMQVLCDEKYFLQIFFKTFSLLIQKFYQISLSASMSSSSHTVPPQMNAIPESDHIELNDIPTPRELELSKIPKPSSFKLDEISIPPLIEGSKIKVPKSKAELIELVTANGDGYEENLITKCNKDELNPLLR